MSKLRLSGKIAVGFFLIFLLLISFAYVGYFGVSRMESSIEHLTQPVANTMMGSMDAVNGVQNQLILVNETLSSQQSNISSLQAIEAKTQTALDNILSAGLLPQDLVQQLQNGLDDFSNKRSELLTSHQDYRRAQQQISDTSQILSQALIQLEDHASRRLIDKETNWDNNASDETQDTSQTEEWHVMNAVGDVRLALFTRMYYLQRWLEGERGADVEEALRNAFSDMEGYLSDLADSDMSLDTIEKGRDKGKSFRASLDTRWQAFEASIKLAKSKRLSLEQARKAYSLSADQLVTIAQTVRRNSSQQVDNEVSQISEIVSSVYTGLIVAFFVGVLIMTGAFVFALKFIVAPIRNTADRLSQIANEDGDLTMRLNDSGHDEVGDLARGFNAFTMKIQSIITDLKQVMDQLADAGHQMKMNSERTVSDMHTQHIATSEIVQSMSQITESIHDVANTAHTAADNTRDADQQASDGKRIIEQTQAAIATLAQEVTHSSEAMHKMQADNARINTVLDVIEGIAEQTNLLALNAAIEAARAGEHGRGFAVVADEVRTLASRTAESTSEIKEIIDVLVQGTQQVVQTMDSGRNQAEATVSQAALANESLDAITASVAYINDQNDRISQASREQQHTTQAMHQSVDNISQLTTATLGNAENIAASTDQLVNMTQAAKKLVNEFKV